MPRPCTGGSSLIRGFVPRQDRPRNLTAGINALVGVGSRISTCCRVHSNIPTHAARAPGPSPRPTRSKAGDARTRIREARTSRHDVWTSTKMFKRSLLRDWPCNQSDQPRRAGSVKLSSTACAEFGTQARCCLNEARASKHIVCTSGKCSCGRCCEIGCAISQMSR